MKALIIGSKGQLGKELLRIFKEKKSDIGEIKNLDFIKNVVAVDIDEVDITDEKATWDFINKENPQIIFNCAAYTDVDGCEKNPDLAFKANSLGPLNIAKAAYEVGARLIHLSTDYVFSGNQNSSNGDNAKKPYGEWDTVDPQSVYGKSKLMGEKLALDYHYKTSVVRTSWLYGYEGKNFVKTILNAAKNNKELKVVDDQIGNPTNANDLAHHLIEIAFTNNYGVFHCTGEGLCSWYDFATEFIKLSKLDCKVVPCKTKDYPTPTKRPAFSGLDNMYLRNTTGSKMRGWKDAINDYMSYYNKEKGDIKR